MTNADMATERSLPFTGNAALPLLKAIACFHFITTNKFFRLMNLKTATVSMLKGTF